MKHKRPEEHTNSPTEESSAVKYLKNSLTDKTHKCEAAKYGFF